MIFYVDIDFQPKNKLLFRMIFYVDIDFQPKNKLLFRMIFYVDIDFQLKNKIAVQNDILRYEIISNFFHLQNDILC